MASDRSVIARRRGAPIRLDCPENTRRWVAWWRERNWDRTFSRYSIVGHGVGRAGRGPKAAPSPPPEAAKRPFWPGVALGQPRSGLVVGRPPASYGYCHLPLTARPLPQLEGGDAENPLK